MRLLSLPLAVLAILLPGAGLAAPRAAPAAKPAAQSAAKPAKTANPATALAKGAYATVADAERAMIESDLAWTGDYNGVIGAEFGDRAVAAVKAFQKRNGGKETGVLNPDERAKLAEAARARQERAGFRIVDDTETGARLGIPTRIVSPAGKSKTGSHWESVHGEVQVETFAETGTTLAAAFERQKREPAGRQTETSALRPDSFVISGMQNLKKFYVRGEARDNEVRGIAVLYNQAQEGTMDRIAVATARAFVGFPVQTAGSAQRRKVEYGTGIVVSASGDIVTDAGLLADCTVIVVPGLGNAERIAEDRGAALVRANGTRDLSPVAFAVSPGAASAASDVTLVGIADPQAQDGGREVSTVRGRIVANGALDQVPAAGFAGAAVIDRDGNLAGMVDLRPTGSSAPANGTTGAPPASSSGGAVIVPAQVLAGFLAAQKIAPAAGHGGIEGAKAGVVRVVCVRK
jgi:hypothetical protein